MGWTSYPVYGKINRKAECDSIMNGETESRKWEVLKSSMVGSTYYAAVRITDKQTGHQHVTAAVCLTRTEGREFWYKDMDETMGPGECKCPNAILDLLSESDNEYALEWRARCREYHRKPHLGDLPVGTTIEFSWWDGRTVQATKEAPAYQFKTPWWRVQSGYIAKNHIPENFRIVNAV